MVAAIWEIRAPDAPVKEHVSTDHDGLPLNMEADTVGRVPGNMEQVERKPFEGEGYLPGYQMINRVRIDRAWHPRHLLEQL